MSNYVLIRFAEGVLLRHLRQNAVLTHIKQGRFPPAMSIEDLPIMRDARHLRCLELAAEAKSGSGFGAILEVTYSDGSGRTFEGRNMRKRPGRYASGGYCEHAENVVLNDALGCAGEMGLSIASARMYIGGIVAGAPYVRKEAKHTCLMCASQMRKSLPADAEVLLALAEGWASLSPEEAYQTALTVSRERRAKGKSADEIRRENSLLAS